jgi:hypothetical protein
VEFWSFRHGAYADSDSGSNSDPNAHTDAHPNTYSNSDTGDGRVAE